ncbi:zinc finger BED domain-containing protein RICESLEEPER 3-like [Diospyros lotus]|uniref:zinc finger BED domain-containing protein RICESLEEPER 3-like n=1 Tax=Diospyros lotus TaxID=55363 RepID=UPI002251B3AD|nr:zinc finger BED domain-containing protein RICESLEEPER 3-like [Diospyros lotus]
MLESALKYRRAFHSLSLCDKNYRWCLSSDEWTRGEIICEFLKPFYIITNLISGSSYPISNLYFGEIWRIVCLLISNLENDDELIASMSARMKEKFDKYWSDYRVVLAFGAILDPTKKFNFLRYTYSKLNPYNYEEKLERVKTALYRLYGEYVNNGLSSSSSMPSSNVSGSQISIGGEQAKKSKNIYDDFEAFDCQVSNDAGKSQLDLYLEEPRIPISGAFDVLAYWRERANRGKIIAKMAYDILSIPITTVSSESAFSIGSRILNKYRSRLHDETVQALLCTQSWLHGFGDDEEEEESSIDDIRLSKQDSNVVVDEEDED